MPSNAATSSSAVGPHAENPALFTKTSMSPTCSASRRISAGLPRSAARKRALPPDRSISSTVCAPRPASRPCTITSKPSVASFTATARPIPDVAPVTSAFKGRMSAMPLLLQWRAEHVGVEGRRVALGSIDGHIQATKPCDRLVNQAAHIVLVAHIGAQKLGFGAQLAEFSNELLALGVVPARSNDSSAFVRKGECCGTSDTCECASNQHHGILHERPPRTGFDGHAE